MLAYATDATTLPAMMCQMGSAPVAAWAPGGKRKRTDAPETMSSLDHSAANALHTLANLASRRGSKRVKCAANSTTTSTGATSPGPCSPVEADATTTATTAHQRPDLSYAQLAALAIKAGREKGASVGTVNHTL